MQMWRCRQRQLEETFTLLRWRRKGCLNAPMPLRKYSTFSNIIRYGQTDVSFFNFVFVCFVFFPFSFIFGRREEQLRREERSRGMCNNGECRRKIHKDEVGIPTHSKAHTELCKPQRKLRAMKL